MNNLVVLRFLLGNNLYIDTLMSETEAFSLIDSWIGGVMKGIISGKDVIGVRWALRSDLISGLHTYKLSPQQQLQLTTQQPWQQGNPFIGRS